MVTLRAYLNPAEAALAKSLLDDYNIFCTLADENVNLYGGGPLAMPIRLLVADEQADEANHILEHAVENAAGFNSAAWQPRHETINERLRQQPARNNPWEILVLALLLLLPGLGLILQKRQLILIPSRSRMSRTSITTFSPGTAHFFGALVIGVVLLLVILFFYIRRVITHEQTLSAEPGDSIGGDE
jgi:hypothetical protein